MQIPTHCTLCPRRCGADRTKTRGRCGGGSTLLVARAALHHWEEPCISATNGSGTVFFSGCSLQCCYCQNHSISADGIGKAISIPRLAEIFLHLQQQGAHNINLVTAGHWADWVIEALEIAKKNGLSIPIVYNTSSYETSETIQKFSRYVDIWLADMKYVSSDCSGKYSSAPDYFTVASAAILQMLDLAGSPQFDSDGVLQRGVIIRHLALPGNLADSKRVLEWIASLPKNQFLPSFMSQYTPFFHASDFKELSRRISTWEYRQLIDTAISLGLTNGYMQEKSSAKEEYTPCFDFTGV